VCLHGITANAHVFEPLMDALAGRLRVVALDQRGHGRSPKPRSGYSAADYSDDVKRFIKENRALLIGHSLGARNALVAATRFPDRIGAVVAIEFTPYIEAQVFDELDARVVGGDRSFSSVDEIRAYLAHRYPRLPSDAVARRAQYGYGKLDGAWRALADTGAMRQTCRGLREDLIQTVRRVAVPALLIRGADSRLVSRDAWTRTRALRPDVTVLEIANADHYVHEEQPEAVADAVLRFWDSIESKKA
jgi:2-(acetamidomethylene)succinate hydrolase